jgi:ABC-type uncharacterized transport system substrate-binding protein
MRHLAHRILAHAAPALLRDGPRRAWRAAIGAVLFLLTLPVFAAAVEIEVVLSDNSSLYTDAARELRQALGADVRCTNTTAEAVERKEKPAAAALIVTLGTRALGAALAREASAVPVVAALVPRKAFEATVAAAATPSRPVSAVFLDQPYSRQLNLIRLILPGGSRVGVLAGSDWEPQVAALTAVARDLKLTLLREVVNAPRELHPALQRLLGEVDSILALPDASVFNASTLPNVLLTSYRKNQPVFGFSPAYVRAGALAAVFSSPEQNARQAAEMVLRALASGNLPAPQYPRAFWVSVNGTVARSLDLKVPEEAGLVAELQRLEKE